MWFEAQLGQAEGGGSKKILEVEAPFPHDIGESFLCIAQKIW